MKKTKVLLTLACAVLLVAASVMGTLAYLTSTATVTNTFTVGDAVTITLDEAKTNESGKPVNNQGTEVEKAGAPRVTANTYKLMPGHEYTKDPTVHVSGEECYVFITVSNGISTIEDNANTIATQIGKNNWKVVDASKGLYIYATGNDTKTAVAKNPNGTATDLPVFSKFKIDGSVTSVSNYANATIEIKAYAVQKDGFEDKAPADIWNTAFTSTSSNTETTAPSVGE